MSVGNTGILSAAQTALSSGKYVEMSFQAGQAAASQVDPSQMVLVSKDVNPETQGTTTRSAFVAQGELYVRTVVDGGRAQFVMDKFEDCGQAPMTL
jgi:hypothetical protein